MKNDVIIDRSDDGELTILQAPPHAWISAELLADIYLGMPHCSFTLGPGPLFTAIGGVLRIEADKPVVYRVTSYDARLAVYHMEWPD